MNNEVNDQYIQRRQNRQRNLCHWKLGVQQIIQKPVLLLLLLPIIVFAVFIWLKIDDILTVLRVPKILLPVYIFIMKMLGIVLPLLLIWGLIDLIGTLTAREDEANLSMAFEKNKLRNGSPVLVQKRKDKKTEVTVREWYSPIPMDDWIKRQEDIAFELKISILKISSGKKTKGHRIIIHSLEGREALTKRGPVYDMGLEKDMEDQ